MDIFKILGLGLISAVISVFIKNIKPEFSIIISICASAVLLLFILPYLKEIFNIVNDISKIVGVDKTYFSPVLKVIGIAYVTQIGENLCNDAGESAIALKIEFAGKISILMITLPVAYKMISIIKGIIFSGL